MNCASKMDNGLELIFTPADGSVIRHRITVLNRSKSNASLYSTHSLNRLNNSWQDVNVINPSATLPRQKTALKGITVFFKFLLIYLLLQSPDLIELCGIIWILNYRCYGQFGMYNLVNSSNDEYITTVICIQNL